MAPLWSPGGTPCICHCFGWTIGTVIIISSYYNAIVRYTQVSKTSLRDGHLDPGCIDCTQCIHISNVSIYPMYPYIQCIHIPNVSRYPMHWFDKILRRLISKILVDPCLSHQCFVSKGLHTNSNDYGHILNAEPQITLFTQNL